MPFLRGPEIIIILGFILLLFGSKRLPELTHGIGKGIHELKKGLSGATVKEEEAKHIPSPDKE